MNPDCRDGKCGSCSGDGWDEQADQPAPCSCACHEQQAAPIVWPDLSGGIIQEIIDHNADWMEWPISGDNITARKDNSLLSLVDWAALGEDPEDALQAARGRDTKDA